MPKLNGPFDITLLGLTSLEVKYASVCILRLPKRRPVTIFNSSDD
jgi:hypothetical protein